MTKKRNRRKQTVSFDDRLQRVASDARQAAVKLPRGEKREGMLHRARQVEIARRINGWLASGR